MKFLFFPALWISAFSAFAQVVPDTTRVLEEITVRAYAQEKSYRAVPAAVAVVDGTQLSRFVNTSLVPAFNQMPGVRLEERSPGSYRVAIRGSSLRSPFGVRNVKVYWNDLPLTDAGGNTYLNQIDPGAVGTVEIIKGPGSSLYGAGTGGVLLFFQPPVEERSVEAASTIGSYGLRNLQLNYRDGGREASHIVQYLHQQSDGYRDHTRMARDMVNSQFRFELSDKQVLETLLLYSDLYYQTPGGLTEAEFIANPRQARPAAGTLPGAQQQNAHIAQKSFLAGISHEYQLGKRLHNRTGVYGNLVEFGNAAIRNWERRAEQNLGARSITTFDYERDELRIKLQGGFEYQRTFSTIGTYQNVGGVAGALQSNDEVVALTGMLFGQGTAEWKTWVLTGGLSANDQSIVFQRLAVLPEYRVRQFPLAWMPRVAILKNLSSTMSAHASVSRGFSPPTLAEIRPSTTNFNSTLQPESGLNYELGWRGTRGVLRWDVSLYHFALKETIVVRRDADGADFFVNAGSTRQNGLELLLHVQPRLESKSISRLQITAGATGQDFTFRDYAKVSTDFSGNQLTGVPREIYSLALDMAAHAGWYVNVSGLSTSRLPLDDGNTAFADAYTFVALKAGFRKATSRWVWDVFSGVDNALDQRYSLGNDLNAAGGRFYNVAPGRQYFAGLRVTAFKKP
jgi:iron complex outermembrane receptor protein